MKLLIVTQVIDTEHPVLGFFHRWVIEFAKHCEHVHVICLQAGKHSLPANVTLHSLGKESGKTRLGYLVAFYKYIWELRTEYDGVFVHMNQQYVILGAPIWKLFKKKVSLWYMHGSVSTSLVVAEKLVDTIFTGSTESFRLPSKKKVVTGHGIDTSRFAPQEVQKDLELITVGRITESKNLTTLVDILELVRKQHPVSLSIVGSALTEEERVYEENLRKHIAEKNLSEHINFIGRVEQEDLPKYLNRAKIFVTTAQNGSLDKAVLEAMACGLPVVSMAPGTMSLPLDENQVDSAHSLSLQINSILEAQLFLRNDYAEYIKANHSLKHLIKKLV